LDSFLVSAVSRDKLVIGYWLAPFLVDIVMNTLCLFISQGFIVINGGE
jgi:multidrug/hemolysin transport system permease protein